MGNFISNFDTTAEFAAFSATSKCLLPHVSLTKDDRKLHFITYASKYLTFVAREQGTFKLTIGSAVTTSTLQSISYSTDNGETWITTNNVNDQTVTITTPTVNVGDKVLWKGTGAAMSVATSSTPKADRPASSSIFSSTGTFDAEGNILSLIWGDDFADKNYVPEGSSYNFALLFYADNMPSYAKVVSAKHLCLNIKNVPEGCYYRMFEETKNGTSQTNTLVTSPSAIAAESVGARCCTSMFLYCTSLTTVPELPANILSDSCYSNMFYGCASLVTVPSNLLPSTSLSYEVYNQMFYNCTSLTTVPELPATTLAADCYYGMFRGCSSLTTVPELPATTLAQSCYHSMFAYCSSLTTVPSDLLLTTNLSGATKCYAFMFRGCTNLMTAPELPATTLAVSASTGMFRDCTNLTTVHELSATNLSGANNCCDTMFAYCSSLTTLPSNMLHATTLAGWCYNCMFHNCTSLTTSPVLSASTLLYNSYNYMFKGCSSLSAITCLATDISAEGCTTDWVDGVAANGTFTKAANMSSWTTGVNGIPNGWTVVDA